ncbi:MAG TPA: chromosome segregation protein SMC [Ktedonobacteraceae bacterium]
MYLKRLEMLGFKSFANKTHLEFSTGITAVVGPNGAGKSNVADSVRWVLGEQSMRQLRGKKSDDIIFAGGQGRAGLGLAEVSLTIDNSTGWVPSDYSEITVTRRSYRSGENEYLINKQKVRLKDVLLLLAQARIGHDSYTVVGQGLIDAALSLRAEERRGLFEDAAGIRPYQVQRGEAENRLRQTEQNLERLRDIVREIEPRLEPLAEQARRALEFKQLSGELQQVLLTWYALQWRRLRTVRERAEAAEREQTRHVQHKEQGVREVEERRQLVRGRRQQLQARIVEARDVLSEAIDVVKRIERDLAVNQERIAGLEHQRSEQQQEERRLRERLIALRQQAIDLEEQCDLADEALDDDAAALARSESDLAKAQKEFDLDQRRLRAAQNDLVQVQARLGASQSDMGRQQKHLGERNRLLAARRDTIAQAQQSMRTLETRLVDEKAQLATARNEEQQIAQQKQAIARAIADAQQEMERLKSSLAEAERQRRAVVDRLNMLKNWRQSLSGYSDGVRALLRAPQGKLQGLLGPIPQLGIARAGQELALEAAFGPYLQAVVVETLAQARACLDYLQSVKGGKAMVVWLERSRTLRDLAETLPTHAEVELERLLAAHGELRERVSGLAWRAIQCEERYKPLFRTMLRGVLLVDELETARHLYELLSQANDGNLSAERLVTRAGEVLHLDGWLTGGTGKDGGQQGLLAYERELRELPRQLDEHVALIAQINDLLSEAQRAQEGRRAEQNAVEKELQKNAAHVTEFNRAVTITQREQDRLRSELQGAVSIEQQLIAEIAGLEQEIEAARERVQTHEKSQRELSGLVEDLQQEVEERTIVFRRQQDELGKARTALAVKRQEARALRQQLAAQQSQAQELRIQIEQRAARIKESEERYLALQQTVAQHQSEGVQAQERVQAQAGILRTAEEDASGLDQQMSELEQESLHLRQQMAELEVGYRKCLLDSQKARDAVESLLEQLNEEMGITDPRELASYASAEISTPEPIHAAGGQPLAERQESSSENALSEEEETELRKLRRRVDALRGKLKTLGGSDPDAPQQYEETRTRYEFMTTQINDMEQAALQLRTIIVQLDVTMARQFEITFQAINARFRENFVTLFKGGSARLELIAARSDEENSNGDSAVTSSKGDLSSPKGMPAGIEVIVQPPGKKVQDLSLLSGGERAMVSAALLFSLLEINPPPFCLLDEVDAALDESNVNRFCDILRRLAQRTQFIVITHNRITMTSAQAIYGVSMGGDSVSRLLSLRLEEAHAVAGDR